MFAIAHAGHLVLDLLQFAPLIAVAAVVAWRTWTNRPGAGSVSRAEGATPHA
jgi:hypothetical protein